MDANLVHGVKDRRVSPRDVQLVQNLIERCLQLYMDRKQVVQILEDQAEIEPIFTKIVWRSLEEQNPDFFKAYYARLVVKQQVDVFNSLLAKQADLMRIQLHPPELARATTCGAYDAISWRQTPCSHAVIASDPIHHTSFPPGNLGNGVPSLYQNVPMNGQPYTLAGHIDIHQNTLASQSGIMQGNNGIGVYPQPVQATSSHFAFGGGHRSESLSTPHGDFRNIHYELNNLNDSFLQLNAGDFFGQFRCNSSLSDLSPELGEHAATVEDYNQCAESSNPIGFVNQQQNNSQEDGRG